MSEEQKFMDKLTSTASDGNNGRKRGRFMGIIIAAVILVAVLIGVGVYNAPANRMSRHLDLGACYLEEQNYEQAIAEFDQVIAILDEIEELQTAKEREKLLADIPKLDIRDIKIISELTDEKVLFVPINR